MGDIMVAGMRHGDGGGARREQGARLGGSRASPVIAHDGLVRPAGN